MTPPNCHRCGHACAHNPPHPLVDTPAGPVCEDETWCRQLRHADENTCPDCGALPGANANAGCEACEAVVEECAGLAGAQP